ncbi:hypothetical protein ACA910_000570 [Epithemia clementina (nom. ined.)]
MRSSGIRPDSTPSSSAGTGASKRQGNNTITPNNNYQQQDRRALAIPRQRFEGQCDGLKGHVFDLIEARTADLFKKTSKEIAAYVGREYKHGGDIQLTVENLVWPTLPQPAALGTAPTTVETAIFNERIKKYAKRENQLEENIQTLWALVWGQSSDSVRAQIDALSSFYQMRADSDGLELLEAIWAISYNVQDQRYICHMVHLAKRHKTTTNQEYLEQFTNVIEVL